VYRGAKYTIFWLKVDGGWCLIHPTRANPLLQIILVVIYRASLKKLEHQVVAILSDFLRKIKR
jgi:hypothetical protein